MAGNQDLLIKTNGEESELRRVTQPHDRLTHHRKKNHRFTLPCIKTCGSLPLRPKPFPGPCADKPVDFSNKIGTDGTIPSKQMCLTNKLWREDEQ